MSNALVLREPNGRWTPEGSARSNPTGKNQWTRGTKAAVLRRLEIATLVKLDRPVNVDALSTNWANALIAPDLAPATARLAAERIWPKDDAGDDPAADEAPSVSEGQRVRLAEVFGEAFPEGKSLVLEPDERALPSEAD